MLHQAGSPSPDPLALADHARIERNGDRIRVDVYTTASNEYLIDSYDVTIVGRSPARPVVGVYAPLSSLCALGSDPAIESVDRVEPPRLGPPGLPNV